MNTRSIPWCVAACSLSLGGVGRADSISTGFEDYAVGNLASSNGAYLAADGRLPGANPHVWWTPGNSVSDGAIVNTVAHTGVQSLALQRRNNNNDGVIVGIASPRLSAISGEAAAPVSAPRTGFRYSYWFRTAPTSPPASGDYRFGTESWGPNALAGSDRYTWHRVIYEGGSLNFHSLGTVNNPNTIDPYFPDNDTIIATGLTWGAWYSVEVTVHFVDGGDDNDIVVTRLYDSTNTLIGTGVDTTWESGYRYGDFYGPSINNGPFGVDSVNFVTRGCTSIPANPLDPVGDVAYIDDMTWENLVPSTLALNTVPQCNNTNSIDVTIDLLSTAETVVGGQFFLSYDNTRLTYLSATPGPLFPTVLLNSSGSGAINFADSVAVFPVPGPGASGPALMATLHFARVTDVCASDNLTLVAFRGNTPPTALTNGFGGDLQISTSDLAPFTIDQTPPSITCAPGVTVNADAGGCTATLPTVLGPGGVVGDDAAIVNVGGPHGLAAELKYDHLGIGDGFYSQTFAVPFPLSSLTSLSSDYNVKAGCFGGGSPRFQLRIDMDNDGMVSAGDKNIFVYFGTPPNNTDCPPLNTWLNTGDLVNAPPGLVWDTSQVGGTFYDSYAGAVALVGSKLLLRVTVAVDGFSANDQDILFDNIAVNGSTQTFNANGYDAPPAVTDNCDASPLVTVARLDAKPLSDPYPSGMTTIRWTATDCAGNSSFCDRIITVNPFNTVDATVALQGVTSNPFSRCITFQFFNGSCPNPAAQIPVVVSFSGGVGTASFDVPCGAYSCMTARDRLHTLRRTADANHFGISGADYAVTFTGTDALVGGNLNDDPYIDILDFGVFVGQFGLSYSPFETCSTLAPNADIAGDGGSVGLQDFSFIQLNFLQFREPNCCNNAFADSAGTPDAPGGPVTDISVYELAATGMADLARADLNLDGRLNAADFAYALQHGLPASIADFNDDQRVTTQDILSFLGAWFAKHPATDVNQDGKVTVQDLYSFLRVWFESGR